MWYTTRWRTCKRNARHLEGHGWFRQWDLYMAPSHVQLVCGVESGHLGGVGSRWEAKPFWGLQQIHYHKNGLKATQKWGNIMKHQSILKDKFTGHIRARSMINMVTHQCVHKTLHLVNDTPSTKSIQKHFNYINPSIWTTPTLIKCRSWPCCLPGLRPTNGIK